jgi:Rod binding domain-containing protein
MVSPIDTQTPTIAAAGTTVSPKTLASIQKSATDFEAVFATQMLTHMYEGMEVNPTFGGGHGEEMFRTVLLDQYGKQMAQNDSLGIVKQVSAQMLRIQEGQNHGNH